VNKSRVVGRIGARGFNLNVECLQRFFAMVYLFKVWHVIRGIAGRNLNVDDYPVFRVERLV
jgi:hypothetical protein